MAMTPLTGMPSRTQSQSAFDSACNDFFNTKLPLFVTEANALQSDVNSKQSSAATSASDATTQAGVATTQAGIATTQATLAGNWATQLGTPVSGGEYSAKYHAQAAAASAASAISSPGTQATSTTSITLGTGSKSFTLAQTGKNFVVGQWVSVTNTAAPNVNGFTGTITSFNSGTGAIVVNSATYYGGGTYTSWTIVQSNQLPYPPIAIGDFKFQRDVGATLTESQATFLRTGTVATAATYPQALTTNYLKSYGVAATLPFSHADFATDGNLTIVCVGTSSQVHVSTDGGATWAIVSPPTPVGGMTLGVCWTGSRFIVASHGSTNSIGLSYSTNGTSWTSGATQTVTSAVFSGPIAMRHDGTTGVIACANGQTTWVFTTTDGTTLTPVVMPAPISTSPRIAVMPSLGANRWLIGMYATTTAYRSTAANGSAWSSAQVAPDSVVSLITVGTKFLLGRENTLYSSSTGLTGSWTSVNKNVKNDFLGASGTNGYGYLIRCQNSLFYDGTRLWVGNDIGDATTTYANSVSYTTDLTTFASWTQLQSTVVFSGIPTSGATICPLVVGTGLVLIKTVSGGGIGAGGYGQVCYAAAWASGPGYVGHSAPITLKNDGTYETNRYVGYIRVA